MSENITQQRFVDGKPRLRRFHQARWDESIIFELSRPGQRGVMVPEIEAGIKEEVGDVVASLPAQRVYFERAHAWKGSVAWIFRFPA